MKHFGRPKFFGPPPNFWASYDTRCIPHFFKYMQLYTEEAIGRICDRAKTE